MATLSQKKLQNTTPSCLEQLLLSDNYFLIINTFSNRLLLEDKYFSVQVLLPKSLEHVFFPSRQFLQTTTFSEEELF